MEVVGQRFRPEFVNRIDDVVVFHPLNADHLRLIVDIQLSYLHERLRERDMALSLDEAARERLAQAGYDPVYGARPLKRALQREVEDPLAQRILNGDFAPGGAISVTTSGDGLEFVKGKAAEAA